jgi:nucleoside-diphosphate-sugar epimerase
MSEVTGKEIRPIYANDSGFYIKKIILDISKIKNITGWSPKTDMFEGIEKTWNWIKG